MSNLTSSDSKSPGTARVVVPHRARWHQRLAAALICGAIQCLSATIRYRVTDASGVFLGKSNENVIFALWHNRRLLSMSLYRRYLMNDTQSRRLAAMVSASRDGGFLAHILERAGVQPVRGSSSRRGPQALREMVSRSERGYDLAITPDGPRGPCYTVNPGVISAAQLTGLRILPLTFNLTWKIRVRSWDRFQIPLPFARCDVIVAPLIRVPRDVTEAERERLREQLEQTLRQISGD
jgi:lysophospholipid acyltransferase (LPLAT)-like uncharacterized protein